MKRRLRTIVITAVFTCATLASGLFVAPVKAADFSIQTGYYIGTGATNTISGLGFTPDMVLIKASTSAGVAVFKTSAMPANATAFTSATADNTATNIQLISDGFTVGTLANVNTASVLYYWTAFTGSDCTSTGNYCVGTYTGNGAASRAITTGFQPSYVMVKRSTAVSGNFRVASEPTNETLFFDTAARNTTGTHIASFSSNGFNIGSTNNTNGGTFYYIAFKETSGLMAQGTYAGDGLDNVDIIGTDFTPNLVLVKNATATTAASRNPVMNTTPSYGDNSSYVGSATANLVNAVQGLNSTGFQIGTAAQVNESGATLYWVAFGGAADTTASGHFNMAVGSYTGTGASLPVTGLGFVPDLVIVKDNAANHTVFRTKLMAGDSTAYTANTVANFTGGITSLDADGFTVGTSTIVNTSSNMYQWQAFGNAYDPYDNSGAADFAIGTYYGNGIDSRNITNQPFQPSMVAVKRNGASAGTWRSSALSGDLSSFFGTTAEAANYVQAINSDGFQIGTNASVNTAANLYHWFAFKTGGNFAVGTYTGTGSSQNITTFGFQPDLAWVKRSTAVNGVHRGSSLGGDATQYFANTANVATRITGFVSTGFSLSGTSTETNANTATYRYAVWRIPPSPVLSADIVDSSGASVGSPNVAMSNVDSLFSCTNSSGILGTSGQRLRVTNTTSGSAWTLTIAATDGTSALWSNGDDSRQYDYNDDGGSPTGCSNNDGDGRAGQMTIEPSAATITPQGSCSGSGISLGSDTSFLDGSISSITLASASAGAETGCYVDITNIGIDQTIPSEQPSDTYTIDVTVTVTAS